MYKRPLRNAILVLFGCVGASHVQALGFGRIPESIPFGQTLDLSVPLRLESGEALSPACLQAEVSIGEQRLPTSTVQAVLERRADEPDSARVRIRSTVVVLEPLVAVSLSVGCDGPVSRQFMLFADPPATTAALAPLVPLAAATPSASPSPSPSPSIADAPPSPPKSAKLRAAAAAPKAAKGTKKAVRIASAQAPRQRPAQRASAAPALIRTAEFAAPRLKLDEPAQLLAAATLAVAAQDAALDKAAQAARAASAAAAAASAAEQRMAALEQSLRDMHVQASANQAAMEQMRLRLGESADQGRLLGLLVAAMLALAVFAGWLALRLRALKQERQAGWWQGEPVPPMSAMAPLPPMHAQPAVVAAFDTAPSSLPAAALPAAARREPAQDDAGDAPSRVFRTAAWPPSTEVEGSLTRAVSVDELIDLEQQAEFFVVLGEEDAAVDLLMAHVRSTGGISPLPYLKLLEIYRRRQDREAYERMRKRFNLRFNAVAPEWDADAERGLDLQAYPTVLAALQAAWHSPLDAMAELESLLFRKHSGELFELPAYRDVLMLYAVARDLHRQVDRPSADVDVLLPLMHGQDMSATTPQSIFDRLDPQGQVVPRMAEDRPTAPVDLDLSEGSEVADSRSARLSPVSASLRHPY